ncbi:MAG: alpha-1,2-fucosyltransferase [Dysgonamonadaceae bacterium]|nr:alpha-1,2-fucosyltransferase [Dysgonamonadaceae bacterium]
MEVIVLSGGLGNQMFQYAFFLAKKEKNKNIRIDTYSIEREKLHNGFELNRLFGIEDKYRSNGVRIIRKLLIFNKKKRFKIITFILLRLIKLTGIKIIEEKGASVFQSQYLNNRKGKVFYFGFWQSPYYFQSINDKIRTIYSFDNNQLSDKSKTFLTEIEQKDSVSIHFRRGDFLNKINSPYQHICTFEYYNRAIAAIKEKIKNPFFVVFSDDSEWVKNNFHLENSTLVDWNVGENAWEDMLLMSKCKHNIIANSTFSWWAAWLNTNKNKMVFAPNRFLNNQRTPDIYPLDWFIIE